MPTAHRFCRAALVAALLIAALQFDSRSAGAQPAPLGGLDAYIEASMRDWKIPGLAIAVVREDSVVFARGYGVRELGRAEPVDDNTVFAIGSASKPFTAAAVGVLVDEGKVRWDDPAIQLLPGFQLFDPYVTRELTVRDLLTHRSGLARGDLMWIVGEFSREEILSRVRHLEPSWGLRSRFGYQNIMYLAAGEVIPSVTGRSWDEQVAERLFAPLGMQRSSTSTDALPGEPNLATPHADLDDQVRPIAWRNVDNIAPAGSINSSVQDVAQWIRMNLRGGSYRGQQVLSPEVVTAMQTPETIVRPESGMGFMAPESNFMAYGLGWFLNDYRGRKVVQHGGNIDGMHALVGMMPAEDLGIVVLTNLNPNALTYALMYRVFDAYLGAPETDWSRRMTAALDSLEALGAGQANRIEEARVTGTSPSLAPDAYAGSYQDPVHGEIGVSTENGRLVLRWGPRQSADLEHWHFDTFRASWRDAGFASIFGASSFVTFALDPRARVDRLTLTGIGEFRRAAEPTPDGSASR